MFFLKATQESTETLDLALNQIIRHLGQADLTAPINKEDCSCELVLTPDRHQGIVPSLSKRDLRLGLTFSQVDGPLAASRGDPVNEQLTEHGYNLAV